MSKTTVPYEVAAIKAFWEQNSSITPPLLGYKEQVQESGMPVPGGFKTYFVWGEVPGVRLGDDRGPTTFWTLPDAEKKLIHDTFLREYK
jgi:hypothetical protein